MKTDSDVKNDVECELKWEPSVNEAHIGVAVHHGIVTLTGHVPTYAQKVAAESATKRLHSVKAVANEIEVKLPNAGKRDDEDLAEACLAALRANISVPDERLKVIVKQGWITLEGELEWQFQRAEAEASVRYLSGVVGVTDKIKLVARATAIDVKDKIEAALKRSAELDARRISVETRDGKVVLHGTVRTWAERNVAQYAAWAAPGVTAVENDLTISP